MLYAALFLSSAQSAWAENDEGFRSKHFLEMDDVKKKFWLHGAITAFSHVAAARNHEQGKCVYNWYFGDKIAERNGLILASMGKYPHATPTSIILVLVENACGTFRK